MTGGGGGGGHWVQGGTHCSNTGPKWLNTPTPSTTGTWLAHGCRKQGGGGGGGGNQGGTGPPSFFGLGGTGGTKKWYQHLQTINNISHVDLRTTNLCIESSKITKFVSFYSQFQLRLPLQNEHFLPCVDSTIYNDTNFFYLYAIPNIEFVIFLDLLSKYFVSMSLCHM